MYKASQFISATRTIKVPLTFEDDEGERLTEEFAVKYKCFSPKIAREMEEVEKDEDTASLAKSLANIIVSIPEIVDGDKPLAITEANLEGMALDNLRALYKGVLADISLPTVRLSSEESAVTSPPADVRE